MKVVASGIDTLVVGFAVESYLDVNNFDALSEVMVVVNKFKRLRWQFDSFYAKYHRVQEVEPKKQDTEIGEACGVVKGAGRLCSRSAILYFSTYGERNKTTNGVVYA